MLYRRKQQQSLSIDLSPLLDVVFLLLIFFMVSTRFKDDQGMALQLPKSESQTADKTEPMVLAISKDQQIRFDGQELQLEKLVDQLKAALQKRQDKMVVVRADQAVSHGFIVEVMDAAKTAGASGISFATAPKQKESGPDAP